MPLAVRPTLPSPPGQNNAAVMLKSLLLLLALAVAARAGTLDLDEAAVRAKYGRPVLEASGSHIDPPADRFLTFEKDDIYIVIEFYRNRVVRVIYVRKNHRPFSREEVQVLLGNQAPDWLSTSDQHVTPDRRLIAVHSPRSQLAIASRAYIDLKTSLKRQSLRGL
jgi:hypothetical protein